MGYEVSMELRDLHRVQAFSGAVSPWGGGVYMLFPWIGLSVDRCLQGRGITMALNFLGL